MFEKVKRVRLIGRALAALNDAIHERDDNKCIVCGSWIDPGEKFHHEPGGSANKEDRLECGVLLCSDCHHERHFGDRGREIKEKCMEYLLDLYPEYHHRK